MAARANGIPKKFLLKILRPLASVGILRSIRGPNGGYQPVEKVAYSAT